MSIMSIDIHIIIIIPDFIISSWFSLNIISNLSDSIFSICILYLSIIFYVLTTIHRWYSILNIANVLIMCCAVNTPNTLVPLITIILLATHNTLNTLVIFVLFNLLNQFNKRENTIMAKPTIITVTNEKGGIGKTTTVINMAAVLNKMGHKTLVIDTDRQANTTTTYQANMVGVPTLYDAMLEEDEHKMPLDHVIQHTNVGDIVASDKQLKNAESILSRDSNGNFKLLDAIEDSKELDEYEYILIDTAPAINKMLDNCLIASDEVLIPVEASKYCIGGLTDLVMAIRDIQKRQNKNLKISGLLLTKHHANQRNDKAGRELLEERVEEIGTKIFNTYIRETTKAKEAVSVDESLVTYAPNSTAGLDYYDFVEEFLKDHGVEI